MKLNEEAKPEEAKPEESQTEESQPEEAQPEEAQPEEAKAEEISTKDDNNLDVTATLEEGDATKTVAEADKNNVECSCE